MQKQVFSHCITAVLPILLVGSVAFGWTGSTHSHLCVMTFDDPVVAPLLSGIDDHAIQSYTGEPPRDTWHDQQWNDIRDRAYIEGAGAPNGNNFWSIDETTRLKYLQHNSTDVAVPMGHNPASLGITGYTNTYAEAILEGRVATWPTSDYPSVVGTSNFYNSRTGHTYNYTGTIDQIIDTHYNACRDNMNWFKNTSFVIWNPLLLHFVTTHSNQDYRDAGWMGLKLGLLLERAVMVDYLLAKEAPVAVPNMVISGAGLTMDINASDSYDPDAISWNSNGTYSQTDDGIIWYRWDWNADGIWDWAQDTPTLSWSVNDMIAWGCPVNTWFDYRLQVADDECKWSSVETGRMYFYGSGGVPEPATVSLLAIGGLALIRKRRVS